MVTSDLTTSTPNASSGGSSALPIAFGVIFASLAVAVAVAVMGFLCLFKRRLWKVYCCRHLRRRRTSQTSIERQFSGRVSQPWTLQGMVGQGRFGHVYKALYNGEIVAVKMYSHHK